MLYLLYVGGMLYWRCRFKNAIEIFTAVLGVLSSYTVILRVGRAGREWDVMVIGIKKNAKEMLSLKIVILPCHE